MAVSRGKIYESTPSAATLTSLTAVPASTTYVITTINVTNRSATGTSFRIAHAPAGAADDNKHYLYYDAPIGGNDTFQITTALPLATTDVIRVYATLATLTFNFHGETIT